MNLSGKHCVVVGATQGIGRAVAVKLAGLGADVTAVGRSVEGGSQTLESMRSAAVQVDGRYNFECVDLVKQASTSDLIARLHKGRDIDHLFVTAGKTPNGKHDITDEGLEAHFALQCLGRYRSTWELADKLSARGTVTVVCAPGQGSTAPLDDYEFLLPENRKKHGLLAAASRDSLFLDSVLWQLSKHNPQLVVHHLFPGGVATNIVANAGFPFPLPQLASVFMPYVATSAVEYANIPVYEALCSAEATEPGYYPKNQYGKVIQVKPWAQDETNRQNCVDYAQRRIREAIQRV